MRDYRLHELGSADFEKLVLHICVRILGQGVSSFTAGRDGGVDCRFAGMANCYPSSNTCWDGKFVIQAKMTEEPYATCSDGRFFDNQTSVVKKEISRISSLRQAGELDYYLLFTNRRMTAGIDSRITKFIEEKTGVKAAKILGLQEFDKYLTEYPELVGMMGLDKLRHPLRFSQEDLKQVITLFHENRAIIPTTLDESRPKPFDLVEKNELNRLGEEYLDSMKKDSELHFGDIEYFLGNPINREYADLYRCVARELKHKIAIHRNDFNAFEEVFGYIHDDMRNLIPSAQIRELTWVFLHFMYFHCDIGKEP